MTEYTLVGGTGDDSLDLAEVYALDAISDDERAQIDTALAAGPPAEAAEFTRRVREARETMAEVSEATATEPPVRLRATILAAVAADRPAAVARTAEAQAAGPARPRRTPAPRSQPAPLPETQVPPAVGDPHGARGPHSTPVAPQSGPRAVRADESMAVWIGSR